MRVVRMRTTSFLICTLRCKLLAIQLWYSSSIMRLVRQCNARSVTVVTSILMHIERRKNKFKVDLVSFFISMLESMLELKLGLELKVGFPVDQTPIRVILEVGLKVPNIDPDAHRKAIEHV